MLSDSPSENPGQVLQEHMIDAFKATCREKGLRITPQRMAVYRALVQSKDHPSAEMLCRQVRRQHSNISLDTVNRTLLTLSTIGAAFVVEGSGESKRFDADLRNHQHFKCIKCRRIFDLHHKPFENIEVPAEIEQKFKILRKTVYLEGICDSCRCEVNSD